jgi:hypothetical protein
MMSNMGEGHMKEHQIMEQLEQYKREIEEGGSNWK